ncbi:hypothetical protein [Methanogenium organophilum]|uniref:Uncharacterized protein n=1 Tax=Methanogenium organophilum TaxID=2199 RepID=A0A9X9S480_METOG|nr:hypothetical protein [Methanogenium organophilum]WAI01442.1 hypothetical protein OU421_00800 [Methanogenium organophilum]
MNVKRVAKSLDQLFHYCLLGILLFTSVIYFFVFVINWEAWFFGMKMDGLYAGVLLFTYCLIASSLAYFLFRYPQKIAVIAGMSIFFFGFMFIDSAVTIQKLSGGQELFSTFLAMLVLVPAGILIGHLIVVRLYKMDDDTVRSAPGTGSAFTTAGTKKSEDHTIGQILVLAVVAFAIVILFGPLVVSLSFMFFSSLQSIVSPSVAVQVPVGDSLISKVDANGTTEWQTPVNGYGGSYLDVCPSHDGGFIMAGMFWLSGEQYRSLRVMKFDHNGTLIWDIHRGTSPYSETYPVTIKMLLPTAGEYTVILGDGFVIRLDDEGNELWHRYYPHDTRVVNSISLPDGGYLLVGEANERGPEGWKKFDGWILNADREGNTVWEKKEKEFTYCRRAALSPEGNLLVNCYAGCYDPDVACSDPDESGDLIVALDLQGNYLWKQKFVEKDSGVVYSMKPLDNGTIEVYLRGEGEQKYTLDHEGNILKEELLPPRPDSFSHEIALYLTYETESLAGNRTQVKVSEIDGSESVFIIEYPTNLENLSRIYFVNPTSDGGYLVTSSVEQ